ncbi:MAG: efflux RND transporter periplasmic adaptor subunit [Candidatus Sumerlaeaceae bacterium]|nr:efflux RND transporter periplasmic adaptor subunit [Candidatus Sumerlaeaceae bacterium]
MIALTLRGMACGAAAVMLLTACAEPDRGLVISGRVEVDHINIGSKVGGRVARVNFDEGESAKRGDTVVALEDVELRAQIGEATATLAQAQAKLDELMAGSRKEDVARAEAVVAAREAEVQMRKKGFRDEEIRQAEAQLASAKSDLELAKKELDSAEELRKTGTVEQRDLDRKRAIYNATRAQMLVATEREALFKSGSRPEEISMAEAQLLQAKADLDRLKNGARPEEVAAQRASVEAARANIARLETQLNEMLILAPADALVETLDLKPGDLVKAGQTVATLNLRSQPWVRCYVPENRLGWVKPGLKVDVTMDTSPDKVFHGIIRRISSDAEFTPRNVQTSEKRAELVFETKVDVVDAKDELRAGMYADVHVPRPAE